MRDNKFYTGGLINNDSVLIHLMPGECILKIFSQNESREIKCIRTDNNHQKEYHGE